MEPPSEEAVDRFRRRAEATDDATLYRNLQAGVYGPPGSHRRSIVERALQQRFKAAADAIQIAGGRGVAEPPRDLRRATRLASRAFWISVVAMALALVGFARSFGWL